MYLSRLLTPDGKLEQTIFLSLALSGVQLGYRKLVSVLVPFGLRTCPPLDAHSPPSSRIDPLYAARSVLWFGRESAVVMWVRHPLSKDLWRWPHEDESQLSRVSRMLACSSDNTLLHDILLYHNVFWRWDPLIPHGEVPDGPHFVWDSLPIQSCTPFDWECVAMTLR